MQVSVCINENEIDNWVLIQTKKKFACISTPINGRFVAICSNFANTFMLELLTHLCNSYYIFAAFPNLFELKQNFYQHETVKLLTNCVAIAKQWYEHTIVFVRLVCSIRCASVQKKQDRMRCETSWRRQNCVCAKETNRNTA